MNAASSLDAADPVALTAALVRCASVTPNEGGALALLQRVLEPAGFRCVRVDRGGIANLYARRGDASPVLGFAGHTDVVPTGDPAAWRRPPFSAEIAEGRLWGRGAVDMKSGVAAFVAAALAAPADRGSIALLITGDEEGDAVDGTRALLDWMAAAGERLDGCVVGEPTSAAALGDQIKIGRRGSLNVTLTARGVAGHTAYPSRARNPLPALVRLLDRLASTPLDAGSEHFEASTLALTSVDVGNQATNVIPAAARAALNIRFNDLHSAESLEAWVSGFAAAAAAEGGVAIEAEFRCSGPSFLTPPGRLSDYAAAAIRDETGRTPAFSTGGGTSDARFIKDHCPVIEVGLVGATMHQTDENVAVDEIRAIARIYRGVIDRFLAA